MQITWALDTAETDGMRGERIKLDPQNLERQMLDCIRKLANNCRGLTAS
jgi:hypothetical protein